MKQRTPHLPTVAIASITAVLVAGWMWARWPTSHPNAEEIVIAAWLVLVAVAFFVAYSSTKKIVPESRWQPRAWVKAVARAFPWAFLFTPSMAFGFIAIPMPAGLLLVTWVWQKLSHAPYLEGPHNATGPIACFALASSWAVIAIGTLFGLKLRKNA